MISKSLLEELKQKDIRVYVMNVPENYCIHSGKIVMVTEYVIKLYNEEKQGGRRKVYHFLLIHTTSHYSPIKPTSKQSGFCRAAEK